VREAKRDVLKHHDHVTLLGRIGLNKAQNKLKVSFSYFAIIFYVYGSLVISRLYVVELTSAVKWEKFPKMFTFFYVGTKSFNFKTIRNMQHFPSRSAKNAYYHSMAVFFFLFISRGYTTWLANNYLQIMSACFAAKLFRSRNVLTTLLSQKRHMASLSCQRVIYIWKQPWWSNGCHCLPDHWWQIIDPIATGK